MKSSQRPPSEPKSDDKAAAPDRRGFLKLTGAGLAAGGAALAPAAPAHAADTKPGTERGDYRESEHVLTYYKLAR